MKTITIKLNGKPATLEVRPEQSLLSAIRNDMGAAGTKEGCGVGDCGTCTVIADGKAIKSCIAPAAQFDGKEIITIEGLEQNDRLHPLQQAFIDHNAIQCGFCSAGFIMTALAFLSENPKPTREEIREAISGNLCRCTGYEQIIDAIEAYARQLSA